MQYWWRPILFASASLVYHAAPTLAFLPPSTFTSTTTSSVAELTPRIQSGYYSSQPTSRITYSGDNTAIASTIQPLVECSNDVFNSAAYASSSFDIASGVFTTDNIKVAFNVATFFPQIPWLFLILLPNANITKKLMGGYEIVTICCLVHFFIVVSSIAQPDGTAPMAEFANVFDPSGDPQTAMVGMMQYPNFVSEEWSHVLTWDLFVGRWIWLDGLRRGGVFTSHSVLLCNLIGPPGLLLHWLTCIVTGRGGLPGNEATDAETTTNE